MARFISMRALFYIQFLLFVNSFVLIRALVAQDRTVGVLTYDLNATDDGYNLIFPNNQSTTYLLDNCGHVVHSWEEKQDENFRSGNVVYLCNNGDLLKTKRLMNSVSDPIWAGGGGAIIERLTWNNESLWSLEVNDSLKRLHHDVTLLPNGNVIAIAWELKSQEEAVMAGRDPTKLMEDHLWPDYLLEYSPTLDSIVWEWHVWDHLIQDFDNTRDNYGDIDLHPELIDINYDTKDGHPDWLHTNAVDYDPVRDHLLLTVPHFDEIWIVDHSTTTTEAASHSGGRSGQGGDLLFRWGNPKSYRMGSENDQKLFFPHDAKWMRSDSVDFASISVFNNQVGENYSAGSVLRIDFDSLTWSYPMKDNIWKLLEPVKNVFHPDTFPLFSNSVSSFQVLSNGNYLAFAGRIGQAFEITSSQQVAWEYKIPLRAGQPVKQGTLLQINDNFTFRLDRYPRNFPAFQDRELMPLDPLELGNQPDFCDLLTPIKEFTATSFTIFPNPANTHFYVRSEDKYPQRIMICNIFGEVLKSVESNTGLLRIDISRWPSGLYHISTREGEVKRLIKM